MHTISFTHKEKTQEIKHPKWYEFWKKAVLVDVVSWNNVAIKLEYTEKECLKVFDNNTFRQYLKGVYTDVWGLQLTNEDAYKSEYIKTEGKFVKNKILSDIIVEKSTTNYIRYTEDDTKLNNS
jgi:hypothetical protein